MMSAFWFRQLATGSPTRSRRPGSRTATSRRSVLPRLEGLEDRSLLSPLTVSNLFDSGSGSLRAAIAVAKSGDTINFAKGLHGTITLTSGDLPIADSVTINGPGAGKLSVSGDNSSRVFDITGSASVNIAGLTITGGQATAGGGILLEDSASLCISNSTFIGNEALGNAAGGGFGGGIEDDSSGALSVAGSTFAGNSAVGVGANSSSNNPSVPPGYILALGGAIDVTYDSTGQSRSVTARSPGTRPLAAAPAQVRAAGRSAIPAIWARS